MAPPDSSTASGSHPPPKKTVRIVKPRDRYRTALISMLVASSAGLVGIGMCRMMSRETVVEPPRRLLEHVEVEWLCDNNHEFVAHGEIGPTLCPHCGASAFPVDYYACEAHGVFRVQVIFAPTAEGGHRVSHRVLPGGTWQPASEALRCPKCRRMLTRHARDLLDRKRPARSGD